MILDIITLIRDIVKMVNPLAVFECDQARMLNVKVDTMERFVTDSDGNRTSSDFVYVEEPTTGYYDIPYRGHQKQRTIMQIYFCKFEPMALDAYKPIPPAPPEPKPVRLVDIIHEGFNMRGITITFENTESKPVDKSVVNESISTNTAPTNLVTALYPYGTILCGRPLIPAYSKGKWELKEYTFPDTEDLIVTTIKVKPEGEFPDVWTFRDIYTMV